MVPAVRKPSLLVVAGCVCLLLAAASLLLPSGPTYDPYSWLIWGRELAHLQLSTAGTGTSWKPLPALIDAVLSPLGRGAADGWLVVARAGAAYAVFVAFLLAWRLAPRRRRWLAGALAAAALVVTHEFVKRDAIGDAEGLLTALVLLAGERHLARRPRQAFGLLLAAALIRVETWPFLAGYVIWLAWTGRMRKKVLAAAVALVPVCWFGGDWLGSGSLTTAADRALRPVAGTAGAGPHPAASVVAEMYQMVPLPIWVGVVLALGLQLRSGARERTARPTAALAAFGLAWTLIVAVMAQRGYAGLPRFLFPACGAAAVVGAVGIARAAEALRVLSARRRAPRWVPAAGAALVAAAAIYGGLPNASLLPGDLRLDDRVADEDANLATAVQAAGDRTLLRCGFPTTQWYSVTALAWDLNVTPGDTPGAVHTVRPAAVEPRGEHWVVRHRRCQSHVAGARSRGRLS